jgi:biotin-dependent carboxylase-like uncharacterized protein
MGRIRVIEGGLLTTVQDCGRIGYQRFGVPVSGVMDGFAYELANSLVENIYKEAVLEITLLGPRLEFLDDTVIAICGGDYGPLMNGDSVPMWQTVPVKKGDVLSFSGLQSGVRGYIAFFGGIRVPEVMGSRSTYTKGGIGGYSGRGLRKGDIVEIGSLKQKISDYHVKKVPDSYIPDYPREILLRAVLGPQNDYFTKRGLKTFFSSSYTVGMDCDRMGIRLQGNIVEHKNRADIISDAVSFGSVQVPNSGEPIIMMADRQTTGGYTKIATVVSADLTKLAQVKPGDIVSFKEVSIKDAVEALKGYRNSLLNIKKKLEFVQGYWGKIKIKELIRVISANDISYINYKDREIQINIKK